MLSIDSTFFSLVFQLCPPMLPALGWMTSGVSRTCLSSSCPEVAALKAEKQQHEQIVHNLKEYVLKGY